MCLSAAECFNSPFPSPPVPSPQLEPPPKVAQVPAEPPKTPEKTEEKVKTEKDTTSLHKSHLFDLHCKICTGEPLDTGSSSVSTKKTTQQAPRAYHQLPVLFLNPTQVEWSHLWRRRQPKWSKWRPRWPGGRPPSRRRRRAQRRRRWTTTCG